MTYLHKLLLFVFAVPILGIAGSPSVYSNEWFQDAGANCSGSRPISDAIQALSGGGLPIKGSGGKYYIELAAPKFNGVRAKSDDSIEDSKVLTAATSKDLFNAVSGVADSMAVPVAVEIGVSVATSLALPPLSGTGSGLIFSYLIGNVNAAAADLKATSLLISKDGIIYTRLAALKDNTEARFIWVTSEYLVTVGSEKRIIVYHGCIYPLRVLVTQFQTNDATNNKIIKPVGNVWRVIDIEDGSYDFEPLTYVEQKEEFFYFTEPSIENGNVTGQISHRISFTGGKWQFKRPTDSNYKTMYGSVVAQ